MSLDVLFSGELLITAAVFIAEILVMAFCYYKAKQPPNPLKPRMFPYEVISLIMMLAVLATIAHIVSLLTGEQLQPRRRRGM